LGADPAWLQNPEKDPGMQEGFTKATFKGRKCRLRVSLSGGFDFGEVKHARRWAKERSIRVLGRDNPFYSLEDLPITHRA